MNRINKVCLLFLIPAASIVAVFLSPELGLIQTYFSLSSNQLSLVMTYYLLGYLLGQGVWGYLSTIIGKNLSLRFGMLTGAIGSFALLYAYRNHDYNLFIIARMLIAFGLSSGLVCGFAVIKENLPKEIQKKFITLVTMFFTVAIYTSIGISGQLLHYGSLDQILLILLCLGCCFFIISLFIKSSEHSPKQQNIKYDRKFKYIEITFIVVYSLALSITTIITYLYSFYAPLITSQSFSLSPQTYSSLSFLNLFFILGGGYFFSYLNRYLTENSICIIGLSALALINLFLIIFDNLIGLMVPVFFICSYLMDIILGAIYPAATFMALEYGRKKSITSAIMNTIKLSLPTISIYLSTIFLQNKLVGFSLTIIICASFFLLSLILLKKFFKSKNYPIIT